MMNYAHFFKKGGLWYFKKKAEERLMSMMIDELQFCVFILNSRIVF